MKSVNSGAAMVVSDSDANRKRKRGLQKKKKSMWEVAGPDIVPEAKFCPNAIVEYPMIKNTRQHPLVDAVRCHLSYLGWTIEYLPFKGLFRYSSPDGKLYISLRQICQDLSSSTVETSSQISQDDELEEPLLASQDKNIASSPARQSDEYKPPNDCIQVSGSSTSEPETQLYPEAIVYWYKNGLEKNRKCHLDMRLKAKKHLLALGWVCKPVDRKSGLKQLRYTSPSGKNFNSLRTACQVCMDEGAAASTKNSSSSTESSITSWSRKRRRMDNPKQLGSLARSQALQIEANSHSVKDGEEHHEDKRPRKVTEISKNKRENRKPTQPTPVLRSSTSARPEVQGPNSFNFNPRTVLSWLIDNDVVMERAKVHYHGSEADSPLARGWIGHDGIKCECCYKVFTPSGFENHAGSKEKRPSANIFMEDGRSLLECQRQALKDNNARSSDRKKKDKGYSHQNDESDEICSICHYGGDIILCDKCPSSFHHSCLGLKEIPEGEWVCPSCCCGICGRSKFEETEESTDDDVVHICDRCEHKFHTGCIRKSRGVIKLKDYSQNKWFCSDRCENVSSSLNELLGRPFPLGVDNLTWTMLKSMEEEHEDPTDLSVSETMVENQSKLNVALELMHECFEPVKEALTGKDLVEDVIFNCRSNLNRLNFQGFYTLLLEKNEEIVSVATIRVYEKVAELPLIATRLQYRKHGLCRLLINQIERQLIELGVERLILPAVPGVLETWTTKFGFSKMTDCERLQLLDYNFLAFQDTTLCHKLLGKSPCATIQRLDTCIPYLKQSNKLRITKL